MTDDQNSIVRFSDLVLSKQWIYALRFIFSVCVSSEDKHVAFEQRSTFLLTAVLSPEKPDLKRKASLGRR